MHATATHSLAHDNASADEAVLHVMRMSGVSGSENHLLELVPGLTAAGWAVDVLIPTPDPGALAGYAPRLERHCRSVRLLPMPHDASAALLRELRAALTGGRYGVVHTHLVHADWHAAAAVRPAARTAALVSTKHNHDPFRGRRSVRVAETLATRRFDHVIAISDSLRRFAAETSAAQATTVRYGLRPPPIVPVARVPSDLLAVGRLEPQKGVDVLLRAFREVVTQVPEARLRIAGDGSLRASLVQLATALGLGSSVEFLGRREDVPRLMAQSGVFVHAARWEGFGLVLLEAMAAETPVVATGVGGIVEVVADGETGVLVPPEDPATMAAAMVTLLRDAGRARAMGVAGRRRVETVFDPDRMARETADVYRGVLEHRATCL